MKGAIIYILAFLLVSCREKEIPVPAPADVLPGEKMTAIIVDIHIAEASVKLKADSVFAEKEFQKIFSKHGATKEQFEKSLNYYIENPEKLNEIYEGVLNDISRMQGEESKPK